MESDYGQPKPKAIILSREPLDQEPEAQLVEVGDGFRVDRNELVKRVDSQLILLANEQLLPYKLYLQQSARWFGLSISGTLGGIYGMILGTNLGSLLTCMLSFFTLVICVIVLLISFEEHGFFILPLCKMYRAKKLFRQVMEELRAEVLDGKTDIVKLRTIFPERAEFIIFQREEAIRKIKQERYDAIQKIYQKRDELIKKAKNSNI